ncbi:hypothetical protein PISMIDRAFT_103021 [Pisolithus microcarpus 441]|uniref:Uncharacterized protein n=1 Tax=Pisolithus microcarpus 441 TaxID=765257 RepID=A0A0C9YBM6_9AGAM|nr:hypothetical protein PISMIDRAFT_103021 [Pisolithus microcarpus 441]
MEEVPDLDVTNDEQSATGIDNDEGWVDEIELLTPEELEELEEAILPVKLALAKVSIRFWAYSYANYCFQLCKLAIKLVHSTTILLPVWKSTLKELRQAVTIMPRDVPTRWNSSFNLLEYALNHRKAIDTVTQRRELGLRKFELGDHEWELILKDATLFFSRSTPNLAMVIPAMDHIDKVFTTASLNDRYTLAIRAALEAAKKTLN